MSKEFKRFLIIIQILLIILYPLPTFVEIAEAQESSPSATIIPSVQPTIGPSPTVYPEQPSPTSPAPADPSPSSSPSQPATSDQRPATIIPTLTPLPTLSLTNPNSPRSGLLRQKLSLLPLDKKIFQSKEKIKARLLNDYGEPLQIGVKDIEGREIPVLIEKKQIDEETSLIISPYSFASLRPGKYRLEIIDADGITHTENFSWGVLAINTNKSIYTPNSTALIAMAVLDDKGSMVCDALLQLEIIAPSGTKTALGTWDQSIEVTGACQTRTLTYIPDYRTKFDIQNETGIYQMVLTADTKNGTRQITDSFEVRNSVAFDVERITATRIFPVNTYDVRLKIKANEDFSGKIKETVPDSYLITKGNSDIAMGYDEISSKSASIGNSKVSGLYFTPYSVPFTGFYRTSQGFDEVPQDRHLREEYTRFGLKSHDGIDFAMPVGIRVFSIDKGKVLQAGPGDFGITVIIEHAWGKSFYGHLSKIEVEKDAEISAGTVIGYSGNTGLSTGPHLHYAVEPKTPDKKNGFKGKVNPLKFLRVNANTASASLSYQELGWNISIQKGQEIILGYSFKAPSISPQLHFLGPLTFNKEIIVDQEPITLDSSLPSTPSAQISQNETSPSAILNRESTSSADFSGLTIDSPSNSSLTLSQNKIKSYLEVFREARRWQIAVDADVTISNNIADQDVRQSQNPALVFTNDQVGYMFFIDKDTDLVYSKTTNGGTSWGTKQLLSDTNNNVFIESIWYDKWTPGLINGTDIHIAFAVPTNDDQVDYVKLDTADDSKTGPYLVDNLANSIGDEDAISITRSVDNNLYVGIADGSNNAAAIKKCDLSSSCDADTDWVDTTDNLRNANDYIRLIPLVDGKIMLIRWEIGANNIECDLYNGTSWAGITDISNNIIENNNHNRPWGIVSRRWNDTLYFVYVQDPGTNDTSEVRSWLWTQDTTPACSDWVQKTDVIPNTEIDANNSVLSADVSIDEESGNVYASYIRGADGTATNLYYKKSTDGMTTWGPETQLNTSYADNDIIYSWLNMADSERIYFAYHQDVANEIMGGTVENLTPPTLDEILKHGEWWSKIGSRKTMTF